MLFYAGQPKRHLLTTGWSLFVGSKRLRVGDSVLFIRGEKSPLLVDVRYANRQQILPSSVLSVDSMHIGVHAAANRSPFIIFYNPRACPLEFVIPLAKYRKSVYGSQVSVGMRFGIMFETDEFGKTYEYHCYVSENGSCRFKGPFMHRTRSHLQRVLGDDNVLIVKFANVTDGKSSVGNDCFSKYNKIAKKGILAGLRCYRFFVFKDGGKEARKKDPTSASVKCLFVQLEFDASLYDGKDYEIGRASCRERVCT